MDFSMPITPEKSNYIHGTYYSNPKAGTFPNLNPATGEIIGTVQEASPKDIDRAVASSREGFKTWSKLPGVERGRILLRAAKILRERNQELAELETLDTAKVMQETRAVDILSGADAIEFFAGQASSIHGHHYDLGQNFAYTRREPLGICAGIGAWNYPIQIACWKSAPALACGNAMIFKPAELTPMSALKLAEIYTEAGLPPGVFNVIQGASSVGQALTRHPQIAKVSLTGEVGTGKKVMSDASATLKHVSLELGGKSPLIIFEDADLDHAVSVTLSANFYSQGEVCSNGTRVFVHSSLMDKFCKTLAQKVSHIRLGDPLHKDSQMGALISEQHYHKVISYIKKGIKEGAQLICGGPDKPAHLKGTKFEHGHYVQPTVFAHCQDKMSIVQEEIFGPVLTVLSFDKEDEVISRANETHFGLAAGVITQNLARAHRTVQQLEAGVCWINNFNITPVEIPFGGYKQSGIGRENGLDALNYYTQLKTVYVEMGEVDPPF